MNRITRHDLATERRDHRDLHYLVAALYLELSFLKKEDDGM